MMSIYCWLVKLDKVIYASVALHHRDFRCSDWTSDIHSGSWLPSVAVVGPVSLDVHDSRGDVRDLLRGGRRNKGGCESSS